MERSDFDALDTALTVNADLVAECVRQLDGAMGEQALAAVYKALVRKYGEQAAAVAVEFYRQQREAAGVEEPYEARVYLPENDALLDWDVRDAYARARERSGVAQILAGRSQQRVMGYADETFVGNAYRDPAHPKWAIVPHPGACGWCVMLGSNDFMYASEATARAARHSNCKCTPCVEFGSDPHLDGYNPKAMQDAYAACRKTVKDDAEYQWHDVMTDEEKARYKRDGRVSYDAYLRNRIAGEMSSRDRDWLQGSKRYKSEYGVIAGAHPSEEEKATARRLLDVGIVPTFRPTRDAEMLRTSDVFIGSGNGQVAWNFKNPKGNGSQTIFHQLEEAAGQAHKVVIDLAHTEMDEVTALEKARKVIRYRYTVVRGIDKGKPWSYDELLLILRDGTVKKITR